MNEFSDPGSGATLIARNLSKRFAGTEVVRGLSFDVECGQCVGLLGPNGAGKTTTMRMIMGLSTVSAGELLVFDTPVADLTREQGARIGLVPQEDNLDPDLSVAMNLDTYGRYFGLGGEYLRRRTVELLGFMQLDDRGEARVMELSGGMKRRLVIARSLVADPEFIILDEPTTGLDPQARVLIWKQLLELKRLGKTLLLTTHYMDEAQRLCDQIIIIDHGEILAEGAPADLINQHVKGHVYEVSKPLPAEWDFARWDHEDIGDAILFYVSSAREFTEDAPDCLTYVHRHANLEDVFLRLTGRALRESPE